MEAYFRKRSTKKILRGFQPPSWVREATGAKARKELHAMFLEGLERFLGDHDLIDGIGERQGPNHYFNRHPKAFVKTSNEGWQPVFFHYWVLRDHQGHIFVRDQSWVDRKYDLLMEF